MASGKSKEFALNWKSENVRNVPGLKNLQRHVDRLADRFKADARAAGITEAELLDAVGNIDSYLFREYETVHYPEHGFKGF
jgi:hypothetical protein